MYGLPSQSSAARSESRAAIALSMGTNHAFPAADHRNPLSPGLASTSAVTISGCSTAKSIAIRPPSESPTKQARFTPT